MADQENETIYSKGAQPPVNVFQLVLSVAVVLLVVTNVVTWFHFGSKAGLTPASAAAGLRPSESQSVAPDVPAANTELTNDYTITNAHDHLYMLKHVDKYMEAAERLGIARTLFVASSEFTFMGTKGDMTKLNDWSTREVLKAADKYPGKIIPFATLHPDDTNKVELLKEYVADGIMGLKLYTGHSNFHDRPLDADDMMPVYAYCEEIGLPLLWHVNMAKYTDELFRVLEKHPNLVAIIPHFGVGFWRPEGNVMNEVKLMLDKYPNIYVDSSFGTREILVGGLEKVSANLDFFKDFYQQYQDKIVWGTDMVVTGNSEKTEAWVESVIRACRDVNEKDRYTFWMAAQGSGYAYRTPTSVYGELRGLNLPPEILKKIYETNINKVLARVGK